MLALRSEKTFLDMWMTNVPELSPSCPRLLNIAKVLKISLVMRNLTANVLKSSTFTSISK